MADFDDDLALLASELNLSAPLPVADLAAALRRQKALPLFTCGDPAAGLEVLEAVHAAGFRIVEFTNRAPGNVDVFRAIVAEYTAIPDKERFSPFLSDALPEPVGETQGA